MKKFSFLVALLAVMAFATSAFAAQAISTTTDGTSFYAPTPKVFNADGKTNYPYEIYLPNENSPAQYRIHSNYTKNTDACAACHATHTAVGNSLLQWYTVYDTCMACHDGTVSTTYNVEEGKVGTGKPTFGGMFGTGTEGSLSNHNVTGAMEIAAAPGGSVVAEDVTVTNSHGTETKQRWEIEFGCESCHTPHGQGGNARILNPDANFAATAAAEKQPVAKQYYVDNVTGYVYSDAGKTKQVYIIKGYPYAAEVRINGVKETTAKIDNKEGVSKVVYAGGLSGVVTIENGVAALPVKMKIENYLNGAADATGEKVSHVAGMNAFCGACHTDYNTAAFTATGSANMETGAYSKAHRHQVGFFAGYFQVSNANMVFESSKMECLTCHVAHGISKDYWQRTIGDVADGGNGYIATANLVELAGSSALKRVPNMGTCEACHAKGDGNEGYDVNTQQGAVAGTVGVTDGTMPETYVFKALTADYAASDLGWVGSAKCEPCHKEYFEGWEETAHATSNHTGAGSCGRCHNPGNSIMNNVGTFAAGQADSGITCESCHGTGKRHISAPSAKNIFNPGTTSVERQAIECGRCHDMYDNQVADSFGNLAAKSGSKAAPVLKASDLVNQAGWSVAFRVYDDNPAQFANASQKTAESSHYGGAWGYADSKHFLGNGTATNPNGIVSCNTCHNMHSDKVAGLLKNSYAQVCSSCHDSASVLSMAVTMPQNSWNRHQLELRDFAHSFKFGNASAVASMTITPVNLEKAVAGLAGINTGAAFTTGIAGTNAPNTFYSVYDTAYGTKTGSTKNGEYNFWRGATSGGGIGMKIVAKDASNNQVFNNYEVEWELVSVPAGLTSSDYTWESEVGAIEFTNPITTGAAAGDYANNGATYAKFTGNYVVKYTSKANPAITGTVTYTVKPRPID